MVPRIIEKLQWLPLGIGANGKSRLMFASEWLDDQQLLATAFETCSIRTHWLWTLIPPESLNLLAARSKNWHQDYVRSCWPELVNIENVPILHRIEKDDRLISAL